VIDAIDHVFLRVVQLLVVVVPVAFVGCWVLIHVTRRRRAQE
jgi:hypothetical protein